MKIIMNKSVKAFAFAILLTIVGVFGGVQMAKAQEGAFLDDPNNVLIRGDYAYVLSDGDFDDALEIIDISNPSFPAHIALIQEDLEGNHFGNPQSFDISGDYAYIGNFFVNSLVIINISDPTNPVSVKTIKHGDDGVDLRRPTGVKIVGNYLFLLSSNAQYIEIFDISDPISPIRLSLIVPGPLTHPISLFVSENYLFYTVAHACSCPGGFRIVDIEDPTQPVQIGAFDFGSIGMIALKIFVSGDYAYILDSNNLRVFDVSDPSVPTIIGETTDAGFINPSDIKLVGTNVFIANSSGPTVEAFDVSDPGTPTLIGKFDYGSENATPHAIEIVGNYAYVALRSGDALDILDISDLTNITRVGRINHGELVGTPPPITCCSSVLFLPGVMGSRLYETTDIEHPLWVSSIDVKHAELVLDTNGKSINDVYTKNDTQRLVGDGDETGIVDDIFSFNIYQSFIEELQEWKDDDQIIEDYAFIPYDWRLSLDDVITNGRVDGDNLFYNTSQDFSESFILQKLQELQTNSRTGKVTIVAHSNGGLVAKALIQKLKDTNNPLYGQIDKVIFVGVPQVGTPEAITGLLHGNNIGPFGSIMDADRSRQLSENMPSIYNFLLSSEYFDVIDQISITDTVISFEDKPLLSPQIAEYGFVITNETELKNYILGTDGRAKPSFSDTVHPNIGNSALYDQAENVHQMLRSWQPHADTKVIQVAGWGEETLAGLDYKTYNNVAEKLSYKPRFIVDGDGTVVVPSALWMSDSNPNVERWWVDLAKNNIGLSKNRVHRDILEISNLRNFIESQITDSSFSDSDNIVLSNDSTLVSNDTRLHYTLHSPLTLGITDTQGRYTGQDPVTGEVKEEVPDVNYVRIGDVQFISAPVGVVYTVKMQGYEQGSFSLDVDKQEGNVVTDSTSFQGIPSSTTTLATMAVTPDFEVSSSILKLDKNGDGAIDVTIKASEDGIATMPYDFSGFLQPINAGQDRSVFKAGSTVPVKFQLKDQDGMVAQAKTAPVWLTPQVGGKMSDVVDESVYGITGTSGNTYRWDAVSQQYIYNWSTKGLEAGRWYEIYAKLDDGNTYSVTVGLK